jgi:putative endonuclease
MFYVYIIQSEKDGSFYKGFLLQPLMRLQQHNKKESKYTAAKIPWQLFHIEIFDNKTAALKREIVLKKYSHQQITELSKSYKNQLQQFLNSLRVRLLTCHPSQQVGDLGLVLVPSAPFLFIYVL